MKLKLPAILVATLLLAGCAPTVWDKAGATQADFNKDTYDCEKDARQSGYYGGGIAGALEMKGFYNRCMVAHGYTARSSSASSPSGADSAPYDPQVKCLLSDSEPMEMARSSCLGRGGTAILQ